ncbi:MAG: hypothetical protein QM764_05775 [Chitinophagaceae bacterium]
MKQKRNFLHRIAIALSLGLAYLAVGTHTEQRRQLKKIWDRELG